MFQFYFDPLRHSREGGGEVSPGGLQLELLCLLPPEAGFVTGLQENCNERRSHSEAVNFDKNSCVGCGGADTCVFMTTFL